MANVSKEESDVEASLHQNERQNSKSPTNENEELECVLDENNPIDDDNGVPSTVEQKEAGIKVGQEAPNSQVEKEVRVVESEEDIANFAAEKEESLKLEEDTTIAKMDAVAGTADLSQGSEETEVKAEEDEASQSQDARDKILAEKKVQKKVTVEEASNSDDLSQENTSKVMVDSSWPKPVVVCGPSGVGKGTLIGMLMKKFPNMFGFSVSNTTRKPREGEVDGVHYNFSTVEVMKNDIEAGKFIEYAEVHGNYYGTSFKAVESVQSEGKICILDIDVQGARNVKKSSLNPIYIFIAPPSMQLLESRLRGRGSEKEEDITKRLENAADELAYGEGEGNFDRLFVNDDLDVTFLEMVKDFKAWYPQLKDIVNGSDIVSTVEEHLEVESMSDVELESKSDTDLESALKSGADVELQVPPSSLHLSNPLKQGQDVRKFKPLVISGPSGVGKRTLIEMLTKKFPDRFDFCVFHTTKSPKIGEIDGIHFNFITEEEILIDIENGKFIDYTEDNGEYYGTSIEGILSIQSQGKICILDIDLEGVNNMKNSVIKSKSLFIAPPSMAHLSSRLQGRGESEEDIDKNLAKAVEEIAFGKCVGNFDKFLVNDELETAFNDLCEQLLDWYPHLEDTSDTEIQEYSIYQYCTTLTSYCWIS